MNRLTDIEIPNVWSSWMPSGGGARKIRRPLRGHERQALERRRDELVPVLAPHTDEEIDRVALALLDMFGGFTSMRGGEEVAASRVDSVLRVVSGYPAWAIERACRDIQRRGVWRDGQFDQRWPPNDPDIAEAVRQEMRHYATQHDSAVALLTAEVEP